MEWIIFGLLFGLMAIATYGVFANVTSRKTTETP